MNIDINISLLHCRPNLQALVPKYTISDVHTYRVSLKTTDVIPEPFLKNLITTSIARYHKEAVGFLRNVHNCTCAHIYTYIAWEKCAFMWLLYFLKLWLEIFLQCYYTTHASSMGEY